MAGGGIVKQALIGVGVTPNAAFNPRGLIRQHGYELRADYNIFVTKPIRLNFVDVLFNALAVFDVAFFLGDRIHTFSSRDLPDTVELIGSQHLLSLNPALFAVRGTKETQEMLKDYEKGLINGVSHEHALLRSFYKHKPRATFYPADVLDNALIGGVPPKPWERGRVKRGNKMLKITENKKYPGRVVAVQIRPGQWVKMTKEEAIEKGYLRGAQSPVAKVENKQLERVELAAAPEIALVPEEGEGPEGFDFLSLDGVGKASARVLQIRGITTLQQAKDHDLLFLPAKARAAIHNA